MILTLIAAVLCGFTAYLVWVEHKKLAGWHETHAARVQQTLLAKNLAVLKDAKLALAKTQTFEQRLDGMLIEVRQSTRYLKEHDIHVTLAAIESLVEANEELTIKSGALLKHTEILMNDPRVQRAIKSG